jgi:hypothetical protein
MRGSIAQRFPKGNGLVPLYAGRQTLWVDASAMTPRTTGGATAGLYQSTTNFVMNNTMDFNASTASYAQFRISMPKAWNRGTITFQPYWMPDATDTVTNTFICGMQAQALSDADTIDTAFPAIVSVSDAMIAANVLHVGAESAAITVGGSPVNNDLIYFQVGRDVADTLTKTVSLIGVKIFYTTNAANDA